jgi:SET domain-containing protein
MWESEEMKNKPPFIIKNTKKYGRGLYATRSIKKGEIVETSPIVSIDKREAGLISSTLLNVYVFEWNKDSSALALGNGSLFNHSSKKSNVSYMNSFLTKEIVFISNQNIKKGQQLFINYGYEPSYALAITEKNKKKYLSHSSQDLDLDKERGVLSDDKTVLREYEN